MSKSDVPHAIATLKDNMTHATVLHSQQVLKPNHNTLILIAGTNNGNHLQRHQRRWRGRQGREHALHSVRPTDIKQMLLLL